MRQSKLNLIKQGWQTVGWKKYLPVSRVSGRGYWFMGSKREHKVIMENLIGRRLQPNEIVHHIDGNKLNNEPTNLLLMTQSEHTKYHMGQRRLQYVTASV